MTIKELYDYAVKHNCENAKIWIDYECSDDYYSLETVLAEEDLLIDKKHKKVIIQM